MLAVFVPGFYKTHSTQWTSDSKDPAAFRYPWHLVASIQSIEIDCCTQHHKIHHMVPDSAGGKFKSRILHGWTCAQHGSTQSQHWPNISHRGIYIFILSNTPVFVKQPELPTIQPPKLDASTTTLKILKSVQSTTHTTPTPDLSADSGRSWFLLHLQGVICCIEDSLHDPIRRHHVGEDAHVDDLQNGHPKTRNALLKGTPGVNGAGFNGAELLGGPNMMEYTQETYHRKRPLRHPNYVCPLLWLWQCVSGVFGWWCALSKMPNTQSTGSKKH